MKCAFCDKETGSIMIHLIDSCKYSDLTRFEDVWRRTSRLIPSCAMCGWVHHDELSNEDERREAEIDHLKSSCLNYVAAKISLASNCYM